MEGKKRRKVPLGDKQNPGHAMAGSWVRVAIGGGRVLWIKVENGEVIVVTDSGRLDVRDSYGIPIKDYAIRRAVRIGVRDV